MSTSNKNFESAISPLAGKPVPESLLIDGARLEEMYLELVPDCADKEQKVSFGTSGHRGTPGRRTFNEAHVLAIAQAVCEVRARHGVQGPLFLGKDTHAISTLAEITALEVLAANGVEVIYQEKNGYTPTPVISHAILTHNRTAKSGRLADGLVITPSHNPPEDAGIKYNGVNGGPAETDLTAEIGERANQLLAGGNKDVRRMPFERATRAPGVRPIDFVPGYVEDLEAALQLSVVSEKRLKIGVHPLGGASVNYWGRISEMYGLDITVVDGTVDPAFRFMTVDHDGKVRMDCSSPHAMAALVEKRSAFDIAFGNDPDADRHGIVTAEGGLMNPNHYLAIAIDYLARNRGSWSRASGIGKTIVSSSLIDKVVARLGRQLFEVPVGFKWFAPGLFDGSVCFGGEESAGASFLRKDGGAWSTDKDGMLLGLLACEITARSGMDLASYYGSLVADLGEHYYRRIDLPGDAKTKAALGALDPAKLGLDSLAGDPVSSVATKAAGNGAKIGGVKVSTAGGWFAARPSGTEDIVKIYAESYRSPQHLDEILNAASGLLARLAQ